MSNSFATPWTVAHQAPLSMRFPRQEYWCGLPFPSPGDLPDPGLEPMSPALAVDSLLLSHLGSPVNVGGAYGSYRLCVCTRMLMQGNPGISVRGPGT